MLSNKKRTGERGRVNLGGKRETFISRYTIFSFSENHNENESSLNMNVVRDGERKSGDRLMPTTTQEKLPSFTFLSSVPFQ